HEVRTESVEECVLGQKVDLSVYAVGDYIDITGVTKGKGYQGVMKKYGYAGGPAAHGSGFHRHMGSTGMRSTPGRCLPGGKRASQMGHKRRTVQNLRIVAIYPEEQLLLVSGAVPGARNGTIVLRPAVKMLGKTR